MGGLAHGTQAGARFQRGHGWSTQHSRRQSGPYPLVVAQAGFDRKVAAQGGEPTKDPYPDSSLEPPAKGLAKATGVSGIGNGTILAGDPPGLGVKKGHLVGSADEVWRSS